MFVWLKRITYSTRDSDVIAKMKGTYTPREKVAKTDEHVVKKKKKKYSLFSIKLSLPGAFGTIFEHYVSVIYPKPNPLDQSRIGSALD